MQRRWRPVVAAVVAAVTAITAGAFAAPPSTARHSVAGGTAGWVVTLPLTQQSRQELSATPTGTAYVMDVGSDAITLWHSGNFGVSWDPLTYLPGGISTFARARFASGTTGYLIDFNRMFRTTNGATTADGWTRLGGPPVAKGDTYEALELGVTGATVAVGGDVLGRRHVGCNVAQHSDIWTSHDGGLSWTDARLPKDSEVGSIRYANARDGVAIAWEMRPDGNPCEYIGDTNSVYVTHDGGRHFARVLRCAAHTGEMCTAAMFLDARRLLVGRNDGTMSASVNGGRTFTERPGLPTIAGAQPTKSTQDESFWIQGFDQAGGTIYATTKLGGAYLSTNAGQTWTRETTCDTAYSLGIGEVAAFDGERAIAGGPTCLSTRTTSPVAAGPVATQPLRPASLPPGTPDTVASTGGLSIRTFGGRVVLVRSLRPATSRAG